MWAVGELAYLCTLWTAGYSTQACVGVCLPGCQTLTLFMTIISPFLHLALFMSWSNRWVFDRSVVNDHQWSLHYECVGKNISWQMKGTYKPCLWKCLVKKPYLIYKSRLKSHTELGGTSPHRLYMGVPPPSVGSWATIVPLDTRQIWVSVKKKRITQTIDR